MWTGLKGVFFLLTVMFLSACSIDSQLFGVQIVPDQIFAKSEGTEIVAGSSQYQTTSNGYKVYIKVQGQMFSE
jgi:hypothetical protein